MTTNTLPRPIPVMLIALWRVLCGIIPGTLGTIVLFVADDAVGKAIGFFVWGVPGFLLLLTAYGVWERRPWGRILELCWSVLFLILFPIGTVISVITMIYLFKSEVKLLFSGRSLASMSEEERQSIESIRGETPGAGCWIIGAVCCAVAGFIFIIISAIAIPNLLNAIDRGKQKRTMADLRTLATAIEMYAIDYEHYPNTTDFTVLEAELAGTYLTSVPSLDGWQHPFEVYSEADTYLLCSPGKDGGKCEWEGEGGPTGSFNSSIYFGDGEFLQYPSGLQQ